MCSFIHWQLLKNNHVKSHGSCTAIICARWQQISNTTAFFLFVDTLWRKPHATVRDRSRRRGAKVAWCPLDGWGGWGYVTKHLASSFQRHMDLHKHILLCVCRFQTHCLTQSLRLKAAMSWNETRWEGGIWNTETLLLLKPTLLLQGILAEFLVYDMSVVTEPPPSRFLHVKHTQHNNSSSH